MKRGPRLVLGAAIVLFVVLSGWLSQRLGTWHEEIAVYPSHGWSVVVGAPDGRARFLPSCAASDAPRFVVSPERPVLTLCTAGRALPVMVSSYFAGFVYWPAEALRALHRDDVLRLRWFGIAFGIVELLSAWTLLRRMSNEVVAAGAVLVAATSTPYVYAHALLVHYEFVPWMLLGAALLLAFPAEGAPSRRQAFVAALLTGLALAGNIKTIFLLVPLGAYLWLRRTRVPPHLVRALPLLGVAALVPMIPLVLFTALDPARGFSGQLTHRLGVASRKLFSSALLREPLNLLQYWSDVMAYGDQIQGAHLGDRWTWILPALSLVYCVVHAVRAARRVPHDAAAAVCGLLITTYMIVVVLLYDQQPEANYAPLHTVLGAATGLFCVAAGIWLARRARIERHGEAAGLALAFVAAAGFVYNTVKRGDPAVTLELSFNVSAQRDMARVLAHASGDVVTTTYNLAGVPDSLTRGRVRAIQAHALFARCRGRSPAETATCVEERWKAFLELRELRYPLSVVVPSHASMVDEPYAAELASGLVRAATSMGRWAEPREDFTTPRGVAVLSRILVR